MFAITEAAQWAQENFGRCDLGDKRRGARLVRIAGDLARNTGASLLKSCDGDEAAAEGLYRWLRNAEVDPDAIAEGGFEATAQRAQLRAVVGSGRQYLAGLPAQCRRSVGNDEQ